jgi:hypothetical protein
MRPARCSCLFDAQCTFGTKCQLGSCVFKF